MQVVEAQDTRGGAATGTGEQLFKRWWLKSEDGEVFTDARARRIAAQQAGHIPEVGEPYEHGVMMICQDVEQELVSPYLISVTAWFGISLVTLNISGTYKVHTSLSTMVQRVPKDLQGNDIGDDTADPYNEHGADVFVPRVSITVEMPVPATRKESMWLPLMTNVNASTFLGLEPGTVQYLGTECNALTPEHQQCQIFHNFIAGKWNYRGDDIFMDQEIWWDYELIERRFPDGTSFFVRKALDHHIVPVYYRSDLDVLLEPN